MTKGQLMGIVFSDAERNSIDTALPQNFFNKLHMLNIDNFPYVWSYVDQKLFGEPVNIYEKHMEKMGIDTDTILLALPESEVSKYDRELPRPFAKSAKELGLKLEAYVLEKSTGKVINLLQKYGENIMHAEEEDYSEILSEERKTA